MKQVKDKKIISENLKKIQPICCINISLVEQLRILIPFADKLGLRDAAEHLRKVVGLKNE